MSKRRVDALIFAGGAGRRMTGSDRPKQFLELGGKPIIMYTMDKFAQNPLVTGITVVCIESWMGYLEELLGSADYSQPVTIVPGGNSGQESIFNGLKAIHDSHPDDKGAVVLVHDGVRPLIDEESITACVESVVEHGPTAVTAPAIETIAVLNDDGTVRALEDRSHCRLARAPQGFLTEELYAAHLRAQAEGKDSFIDSVSLMAHYGYTIHTVEGPVENIKITTPADYFSFKSFMDMKDLGQLWGN